jgi:hypothetical protein
VLLDSGDPVGPVASGAVGIWFSGGVHSFGFGKVAEEDVESFLQGRATHKQKPITSDFTVCRCVRGGWGTCRRLQQLAAGRYEQILTILHKKREI